MPICQLFDIDPDWIRGKIEKALRDPSALRGTWNPGRRADEALAEISGESTELARQVA